MPGVIPLEDAQDMYTSRLQDHANGLFQQAQAVNQPPLQNVSPEAIPADAVQAAQSAAAALQQHAQTLFASPPEPQAVDDATQSLQQHAQSLFDAAQTANQPPLQGVDPVAAVLGAAEQAGADMSQFAQTLSQHLQTAGGDVTSAALGAAEQSGANMSAFTGALNAALPQPSATTSPSASAPSSTPTGGGGGDLRDYAKQAAQKAGIDPDIFSRQIQQESGFDPSAKSGAGAVGIAQFMPSTARGLGIDPTDPYAALTAAANLDAQNLKRYNGDYAKALAAYNAGPGAVDDAGGVPDFAETKRYVSNILGGAASAVGSAASAVGTAADTARGTVANAVLPTLSQFGDRELNSAEAYSACGPAAAVRFSQMFGRNPTLREAVDLAKNVGWTADTGMAGLQSESKLFDQMNIPHRVIGADWQAFAKEAQSGNPVTLSTPGHYFTADAYDPSSGAFHVGSSGTDLRGGKEWMTPAEMEQRMGPLQGGLAADNPNIPGTSPLSQGTRPAPAPTNIVEQGASVLAGGLQQVDSAVKNAAQNVGGAVQAAVTDPNAGPVGLVRRVAQGTADVGQQLATEFPQHMQHVADQLQGTPGLALAGMLRGPELLSDEEILRQPQADTARQLLEQFRQASIAKGIAAPPVTDQDVAGAARTMLEGQAITMTGRGIGREPLPAEPGAVTPPAAAPAEPASTRMYHGTGAAFDRPGQFDPNGLYGPGYYVTSDPQVAGGVVAAGGELGPPSLRGFSTRAPGEVVEPGYAQARPSGIVSLQQDLRDVVAQLKLPEVSDRRRFMLEQRQQDLTQQIANFSEPSGPNVRAVDVPKNLTLLDMEGPVTDEQIQRIGSALGGSNGQQFVEMASTAGPHAGAGFETGADLYDWLGSAFLHDDKRAMNRVLQQAGFDGITYEGGQRIPMTDASGADIQHQATVVFPESLDKIRNAISGRQGGAVDPLLAARLGGTVAGGVAGYQSAPADASDEERLTRTLGGAAIGAGGVNAAALGVAGARALGGPVSRFGSTIASALGPTESLPAAARTPIQQFANMVGRQSDAASVMAHSSHLLAGGLDDAGNSIRQMLRSDASKQLVRDLQAQGLAVPVGDAPRHFRLVTDVPGNPLSNYAFDPSVVGPIKAVIDRSMIAGNPLGSSILNAVGTAKSTLFSLSNFHTITEGLNAGFSSPQTLKNYARAFLSDSFTQAARGQMSDTFDAAAQAGVTGLSGAGRASADVPGQLGSAVWRRAISGTVGGVGGAAAGYTEAKIGGKSDEEARQQALMGGAAGVALGAAPLGGRGTVPEILQSSLWERAVPMAKATAWDALTKGGLAPDVAAKVVNERFGGLNYAAMGRSPTLMDATRLLVQAPDWTESTVRQLGSAMFGGTGQGVRAGFLAKAIAGTLAVTEVANYALSGHSTLQNQPGHQFEIETRDPAGGFMHIGLLPGNVQSFLNEGNKLTSDDSAKRAADLTNFVTGRLSEPARLISEAGQTAAAGGSSLRTPYAVGKAGPVAGLLSTLAPVGISQVAQGVDEGGVDPKLAVAMAAAGLNPRYTSAAAAQRAGFTAPGTTRPRTAPPVAPRNVAPVQRLKK